LAGLVWIVDPAPLRRRIVRLALAGPTRRSPLAAGTFAGTIWAVSTLTILVLFLVHRSSFRV
jgi:hypothetical protein